MDTSTVTITCKSENDKNDAPVHDDNDNVDCFPQQDKQPVLPQQDISPIAPTATDTFPSLINSYCAIKYF